jgi:biopolymer transport protein ExbD
LLCPSISAKIQTSLILLALKFNGGNMMMNKHVLTFFTTLAMALSLASCSPRKPAMPSEWEGIDLPVAVHFKEMPPSGESSFSLTIDKTGALTIYGALVTESNLVNIARNRCRQYGVYTTTVFSDAEATFESFWAPIQGLREIGLWKFNLAAHKGQADERHNIGIASFAAPVKEHDIQHKGSVTLPTEGPLKGILLKIDLDSDALKLNGRVISLEQLSQHFREYATFLKSAAIVLIPSPQTRYSQIIRVVDACAKYDLKKICIMEDLDAQPTEPPYPEIKLMEAREL